jgi:hypothetical protein
MGTSVGPMQGTGQIGLTNAFEMVHEEPLPLSVVPCSVVPPFSNTIIILDCIIVRQKIHQHQKP